MEDNNDRENGSTEISKGHCSVKYEVLSGNADGV